MDIQRRYEECQKLRAELHAARTPAACRHVARRAAMVGGYRASIIESDADRAAAFLEAGGIGNAREAY